MKLAGGTVIAQDKATSAVWGMPGSVVREGVAACTVPLGEMAQAVTSRVMPAAMTVREMRREVAYGLL